MRSKCYNGPVVLVLLNIHAMSYYHRIIELHAYCKVVMRLNKKYILRLQLISDYYSSNDAAIFCSCRTPSAMTCVDQFQLSMSRSSVCSPITLRIPQHINWLCHKTIVEIFIKITRSAMAHTLIIYHEPLKNPKNTCYTWPFLLTDYFYSPLGYLRSNHVWSI